MCPPVALTAGTAGTAASSAPNDSVGVTGNAVVVPVGPGGTGACAVATCWVCGAARCIMIVCTCSGVSWAASSGVKPRRAISVSVPSSSCGFAAAPAGPRTSRIRPSSLSNVSGGAPVTSGVTGAAGGGVWNPLRLRNRRRRQLTLLHIRSNWRCRYRGSSRRRWSWSRDGYFGWRCRGSGCLRLGVERRLYRWIDRYDLRCRLCCPRCGATRLPSGDGCLPSRGLYGSDFFSTSLFFGSFIAYGLSGSTSAADTGRAAKDTAQRRAG